MKHKVRLGVIGCGFRGSAYSDYAISNPDELEVVCACDILEERLIQFSDKYHVKKDMRFIDAFDMIDSVDNVDIMVVANLDADHFEVAKAVLQKGINCLLEKPMSPDAWECLELVKLAEENNCKLLVCHVLRYTPIFSTLKELIDKEEVGKTIAIHHSENVSYTHIAHSYVRGNFRKLSPIILAKSCHDLDILNWLVGKKCKKISSFGELTHFKSGNAPEGSGKRCMDCSIESECPFSALKQYLTEDVGWPTSLISVDTSLEARRQALKEGDYGRCVYHCDNTVVDHQIVNMLYEDDITVSFNLNGFNATETREIRILGTKGDIRANMEKNYIAVRHFGKIDEVIIRPKKYAGAHSGGDTLLMKDIIALVQDGNWTDARTSANMSVDSHIMAFAAEKSRLEGVIVDIDLYKNEIISKGR